MDNTGFELWLIRNNRKPATIKRHLKMLRKVLHEVSPLNTENTDRFLLKEKERGISNGTLNIYIDVIRKYAEYAGLDEGLRKIHHFTVDPFTKSTMTLDELTRFLAVVGHPRANLYWHMVALMGCRPSEIANLKLEDIQGEDILIRCTKTNMPRKLTVPAPIMPFLQTHLNTCSTRELFVTSKGKVFSYAWWSKDFKYRLKKAGITDRGLSAYSLRHGFATDLIDYDANLFDVKAILGHKNIETTERYYHMSVKRLRGSMNKHPLIRKQIKYSKDEAVAIMTKFATDHGFEYEIDTDGNRIRLEAVI